VKDENLPARQSRFVEEYLIDLNATQACIRAGYSKNGANVTGSQLLANESIQEQIHAAMDKRSRKLELSADKVLREISLLAFSNMLDYIRTTNEGDAYVDLGDLDRDQAASIQEITVEEYTEGRGEDARDIKRTKFKLSDKTKNLELLARHLGIFADEKGTTVNGQNVLVVNQWKPNELPG
jgi:phage terminase small subunit